MNLNYIRSDDYFIPDLELTRETRPIGKWGRTHREYRFYSRRSSGDWPTQ